MCVDILLCQVSSEEGLPPPHVMRVRSPVINISLPDGPGEEIWLGCFGPQSTIKSDGNKRIQLMRDRFIANSRRASMYAVT